MVRHGARRLAQRPPVVQEAAVVAGNVDYEQDNEGEEDIHEDGGEGDAAEAAEDAMAVARGRAADGDRGEERRRLAGGHVGGGPGGDKNKVARSEFESCSTRYR